MTTQKEENKSENKSNSGNSARTRAVAIEKIEKLFSLYRRPGTDGEKVAARSRIEAILPKCTRCEKVSYPDTTDISCMSCTGAVFNICSAFKIERMEQELIKAKAEKATGRGRKSSVNYDKWILLFLAKTSKDDILREMISVMSLTAAADLYGKLSCCLGAVLEPMKKDSLVYKAARHFLGLPDSPMPTGHAGSIRYVQKVVESVDRMRRMQEESEKN